MLLDFFKKKVKRPPNGGSSSFGEQDSRKEVPKVENVLDEVDKALRGAEQLREEQARENHGCWCGPRRSYGD